MNVSLRLATAPLTGGNASGAVHGQLLCLLRMGNGSWRTAANLTSRVCWQQVVICILGASLLQATGQTTRSRSGYLFPLPAELDTTCCCYTETLAALSHPTPVMNDTFPGQKAGCPAPQSCKRQPLDEGPGTPSAISINLFVHLDTEGSFPS